MKLNNRRICRTVVLTILAIGLLAGCGKEKTIDYTIDGMEQVEQPGQEEGRSGLDQLAKEEVWEEQWTSAPTGETFRYEGEVYEQRYGIEVHAQITVPKTAQMLVVEVEEPEFDAEYKEKVAKGLFDSGEVYYGDYSHLPKKDLIEIQDKNEAGYIVYFDEWFTREKMEADSRELQEALDNIETAGDSYVLVEDYTGDEYIGLCEGRLYNLSFAESGAEAPYANNRTKRITWTARNMWEVCPEKMKEQEELIFSPWMRGNWVENQCQISEEEAQKEAKRLVDKLGLDYPVQVATYPLLWGEAPAMGEMAHGDNWYVDGYVFAFDLGVDDISFVSCGVDNDYKGFYKNGESTEEKQYSMDARLWVYVTDQGVIKMEADNPIEISGVKESVGLLSLDAIQGIMREKTEEQWDIFRYDVSYLTDFNAMDLIYFRVRDRENPGKFSYVPAWRLAAVTRDELLNQIIIYNQVLVNAIDGSLIDFYDET